MLLDKMNDKGRILTWQASSVLAVSQETGPRPYCSSSHWWWMCGRYASLPSSWPCWLPPRAPSCSLGVLENKRRATVTHSSFSMDLTSWCKELLGDMLHTQQWLSLSHPELVMELLADHSATGIKLMSSHVGDFQQHGWHQVHTLQQLQVDVHVEWHLQKVSAMSWWIY